MTTQQYDEATPLMERRKRLAERMDTFQTDRDMIVQYGADGLVIKSGLDNIEIDLSEMSEEALRILLNGIEGAYHRQIVITDEELAKI